jgi:hypothetical protein
MLVFGALVVLGCIGVALASATSASAATGSGKSTAIDSLLAPAAPLLDQVSTVLGAPAASATHHAGHAHASIARPAHSAPVTKAASTPSADRHPRSTATGSDRLPLLRGLADLLASTASNPGPTGALFDSMMAVAEPVSQVTCSIAPGITRPAGQDIKDVGAAVTSIAPVTSVLPLGSLLDLVTMPLTGDAPGTAASGPAPGPGPGAWSHATPPTSPTPRAAQQPVARPAAMSAPSFGPTGQSLPAAPTTNDGLYSGSRIPAPAPAPPAVPDLAVTTASGSTATSNPRSGTGVPSGFSSETWSAQQLRLLGTADSTASRSVRDSATKPPVSPD